MIQHKINQNIFKSECKVITNPTNSVGVMGGGLAYSFYLKYRKECEVFNDYSISYQMGHRSNKLLKPMIIETFDNTKLILMFPTKIHWKNYSKYEYVDENLKCVLDILEKFNNPSIAIPALGCGLGGLAKNQIIPKIEETFKNYSSLVELYY